jgi:hypothetical protein
MHEELWAGVDLKIEHAAFFLEQMGHALAPPERSQINVAMQSGGAIMATGWQRSFYAYADAFLAMARCVLEVINACFGADPVMKNGFKGSHQLSRTGAMTSRPSSRMRARHLKRCRSATRATSACIAAELLLSK